MASAKIHLNGLVFFARHGVLEEEARLGQRFSLDVVVSLGEGVDFMSDAPEATVNYADIHATVAAVFTGRRFNLIEAAAGAIGDAVLEQFAAIEAITVTVRKPSVPVDCVCDHFAAEVTRCR
jgi:dihydroneopterin aldolase